MEQEAIIYVSVFSVVSFLLLILVAVLFSQVSSLRRRLEDLNASGRLRVQKLQLENDKNHAFHNPVISPDEELAKRGFSMYAKDDVESGRATPPPRQTGGQLLEELSRELDYRHKRQELQDEYEHQQQQQLQSDYQQSRQRLTDYQKSKQEQFHNQSRQDQYQSDHEYHQPRQRDDYQQPRQDDYQQPQPRNDHLTKQHAPSFLLQSIEENKRKSRQLANPHANGRQSDTNPNFIY